MARRQNDPLSNQVFLIDIDNTIRAGFSECSGLNAETTPIEYREGNEDITTRKLPSLIKYGNITLKRGLTIDLELSDWFDTVKAGNIERKNISIVLRDEQQNDSVRWNLSAAWPCKYVGPDLKADANEIAIESLEICHEGLTKELL